MRRALTGNNAPTIDIAKEGVTFAGTLVGVRAIPFGKNRDGSDDIRYIGDFEDAGEAAKNGADKDGKWSAWLPTQLRNLLVDTTTNVLKVPRGSRLWLTFSGEVPTKGGGNPTKIFNVEIDDALSETPSAEPTPDAAPAAQDREEREPATAGRGSRSRR